MLQNRNTIILVYKEYQLQNHDQFYNLLSFKPSGCHLVTYYVKCLHVGFQGTNKQIALVSFHQLTVGIYYYQMADPNIS